MTARPFSRLALLLLLTGCSTGPAPSPVVADCQSQAKNDPAVKAIIMRGLGNPYAMHGEQDKLQAAEQDATTACLRRRGAIRPGGVERQKVL